MKTAKELIKITFFNVSRALCLAFRPSATGGISWPCPPNHCLCPPSEDCAPKKLTCSVLLECKSSPETPKILLITLKFVSKNCFFAEFAMITDCFCGLTPEVMKLRVYFGTKTFILFYFLLFASEFVEIRTIFEMENGICENARALFQIKTLFFLVFISECADIRVGHFFRLVHTLEFK